MKNNICPNCKNHNCTNIACSKIRKLMKLMLSQEYQILNAYKIKYKIKEKEKGFPNLKYFTEKNNINDKINSICLRQWKVRKRIIDLSGKSPTITTVYISDLETEFRVSLT